MFSKSIAAGFIGLALLSSPMRAAESPLRIQVTLPATIEWELATNKSDDQQYLKEWILKGSSFETTKWLIVEQKLVLPKKVSAKKYLANIFSGAKAACSHVLFNGPEQLNVKDTESVAGRFMCAQQKGKDYGTFTDQRIIVDGKVVFVITSEIRTDVTEKAGVFAFPDEEAVSRFMRKQAVSAKFVRNAISICSADSKSC